MAHTISWIHQGYTDGLNGQDPNPEMDRTGDYTQGYLAGMSDREAGFTAPKYFGYCEKLPVIKGQVVTIPKGTVIHGRVNGRQAKVAKRTYKVTVDHVFNGCTAYAEYHPASGSDGVVRPTNPKIVWSGAGNYWHEADVNDIPECNPES